MRSSAITVICLRWLYDHAISGPRLKKIYTAYSVWLCHPSSSRAFTVAELRAGDNNISVAHNYCLSISENLCLQKVAPRL